MLNILYRAFEILVEFTGKLDNPDRFIPVNQNNVTFEWIMEPKCLPTGKTLMMIMKYNLVVLKKNVFIKGNYTSTPYEISSKTLDNIRGMHLFYMKPFVFN